MLKKVFSTKTDGSDDKIMSRAPRPKVQLGIGNFVISDTYGTLLIN